MDQNVNNWAVIIKRGDNLNITLSTIYFDKWGSGTKQEVIIVDDWVNGSNIAVQKGYKSALFVDSGTIFVDWPTWKSFLNNYPHKGLIAHIIQYPGKNPHLHPQCWFMNLNLSLDDVNDLVYPTPLRSDENLHDDYTPLWLKPGSGINKHTATEFGQSLIAQQLSKSLPVVNWNNHARDLKKFIYDKVDFAIFQDYINLAENQLWVFNNESILIVDKEKIVCPGSGLFWVLNIISPHTKCLQIVDISNIQVKFCRDLWEHWSGLDYGSFVVDFINRNNLKHYELDVANMSEIERLKLKSNSRLKEYVNNKFQSIINYFGFDQDKFQLNWNEAKTTKTLKIEKNNLVDWIVDKNSQNHYDYIWGSNVDKYKWTMLHNSENKIKQFQRMIK